MTVVGDQAGLPIVSASQLKRLLADPKTVILDVRGRLKFRESHILGSLDIPLDEIEERGPHELPRDQPIIVFCHLNSACAAQKRQEGTMGFCSFTNHLLHAWYGFSKVKYISDDLCTLAADGIPVTGTPKLLSSSR